MSSSIERKRVLVIDDERSIADTLAEIFLREGYDARAAYSAEQALALISNSEWHPDLALIDVCLPEMNGIALAILLRAEYPDCRALLFSGQYNTSDLLSDAEQKGHTFEVLAKPIHPTELLGLASRLLFPQQGPCPDIA